MPSPVHRRAMYQLCVSIALLPLSTGCANVEARTLTRPYAPDGSSLNREVRHEPLTIVPQSAPPVETPAHPTEAAFMVEGSRTVVGYDAFGPEGPLFYRTTFTPRPGSDFQRPAGETVWLARRERFEPQGNRSVEITSSLECPGLLYVLERVSALDAGRFDVSGISRRPLEFGPQSRDGYTYRFFGPGYDPVNAHTRLTVEGSSGDIGALGQVADFQLRACWRPE